MNYKHFKFDLHFIFNMIAKCPEIPLHDKILLVFELLLLQFRAIKCMESPLSDRDNHGISKENVEARKRIPTYDKEFLVDFGETIINRDIKYQKHEKKY